MAITNAKNKDGSFRFIIKLDDDADPITQKTAREWGLHHVIWQDDTTGIFCASAKREDWNLTANADENEDIEWVMPDLQDKVEDEVFSRLSKEDKAQAQQAIGPVDQTSDWSGYERNWQWPLQAMGLTVPADAADQSDPENRPPKWVATQNGLPGGIPYEGSGTVLGVYMVSGMPAYMTDAAGDPIEPEDGAVFFGPPSGRDAKLHPAFHNGSATGLYRNASLTVPLADSVFTEDPAAAEVDADGGIVGFDIFNVQQQSVAATPGFGDGTTAFPTSLNIASVSPETGADDTKEIVITAISGGNVLVATAAATTGNITGDVTGTATINFSTGVITGTIVWNSAIDLNTPVVGSFFPGKFSQEKMLQVQRESYPGSGGAWDVQPLGVISSRSVGDDVIPQSGVTPTADQLAIRGRTKGIAPRSKVICYVNAEISTGGGPGTFSASQMILSIYKAIEHNVQVFWIPWNTQFFPANELFGLVLNKALQAAKNAGMLVIISSGFYGADFDQSPYQTEWMIGDTSQSVLQVSGTAPRDYSWDYEDDTDPTVGITAFNPDDGASPQKVDLNLDRMATTNVFFGFFFPLMPVGFGGSQSKKVDVAAPMGSIPFVSPSPQIPGILAPPPFIDFGNQVLTTAPYTGAVDSITFPYLTGLTYAGWCSKGSMASAHAAGVALLAFEAWKVEKGTYPKGKQVRQVMRSKADGKVGPEKDFNFISADRNSSYASDSRYTLFYDPSLPPNDPNQGDLLGLPGSAVFAFPPFIAMPSTIGTGFGLFASGNPTATWYSHEHPADKKKGKDPAYGKGRLNMTRILDHIKS